MVAAVCRASGMGAGDAFRLLREHPRSFDSLWYAFVAPPQPGDPPRREEAAPCDIDAILRGNQG